MRTTLFILCALLLTLCGCSQTPVAGSSATAVTAPSSEQQCPDPRPQMCTMEYNPVCATRDTGIRCVKAPCPSTEAKTYASGCSACRDDKVISYSAGACTTEHAQ